MTRNQFTPEQERWLTALESGEYRQVRNSLSSNHGEEDCGYCCLGVAVHLHDPNHYSLSEGQWDCEDTAEIMGEDPCDICGLWGSGDGGASPEVAESLHLSKTDGSFRAGGGSLLLMNDDGASFAEIALLIRKEPWRVFTNFDIPEAAE